MRGTIRKSEASTLIAYARVFGCTVGWLVAGEGAPPTDDEIRAAVERARLARSTDASTRATGTEG